MTRGARVRFVLWLTVLCFAASGLGCANVVQDPKPGAEAFGRAIKRGPVRADPLFWRVEPNAGGTLYLLGSVHAGPVEGWRMPESIRAVFERCEVLVVEVDPMAVTPLESLQVSQRYMLAPTGSSLADLIPASTLRDLELYMEDRGEDVSKLMPLRPWAVALMLTTGVNADLGLSSFEAVEMIYLTRREDREVVSLETAGSQLSIFGGMSPELEVQMLQGVLDQGESAHAMTDLTLELADAWRRGDEPALEALMGEGLIEGLEFAEINQALMGDRNVAMARKLAAIAADPQRANQSIFVVIGAGHFVGDGSIRDMLVREHGLTIEQLGPARAATPHPTDPEEQHAP